MTASMRGADVNHGERADSTALIHACYAGHRKVAEVLIRHKANIEHQNSSGGTALMFAALRGQGPCVELLLKLGLDVTRRNQDGSTAADLASVCDYRLPRLQQVVR